LKNELKHHTIYKTRQEAKAAVFDYIEFFYNRLRPHQILDYRTLPEAEATYIEMLI
jgi:putative transposase